MFGIKGFVLRVNETKAHTLRTAVRVKELEIFVLRLQQEVDALKNDQDAPKGQGAGIYVGSLMGVHLYAYGNGLSSQTRAALDKFFRSIAAMGSK